MIIGGISLSTSYAAELSRALDNIRLIPPYKDSLQWKSANKKKLHKYEELISFFVEQNRRHKVDFHAVAFDTRKIDHYTYSENDHEDGFYKFVFQSMYSNVSRYSRPRVMRCVHGNRDSRYTLPTLSRALNGKAYNDYGLSLMGGEYRPFPEVQYGTVSTEPLLQLADVLIGAVSHAWNGKMERYPNHVHTTLVKQIQEEVAPLDRATPASMRHFDIWEFRLGPRGLGQKPPENSTRHVKY